jgi:hypothetical protein
LNDCAGHLKDYAEHLKDYAGIKRSKCLMLRGQEDFRWAEMVKVVVLRKKTEGCMPIRHANQGAWGTGASITILSFLVEIQGQTGR